MWTNPISFPNTSPWPECTISITDLNQYNYIEIYYTNHVENDSILTTGKLPLKYKYIILLLDRVNYRTAAISLSDNTIVFSKGYNATTESNYICAPIKIIGYK